MSKWSNDAPLIRSPKADIDFVSDRVVPTHSATFGFSTPKAIGLFQLTLQLLVSATHQPSNHLFVAISNSLFNRIQHQTGNKYILVTMGCTTITVRDHHLDYLMGIVRLSILEHSFLLPLPVPSDYCIPLQQ